MAIETKRRWRLAVLACVIAAQLTASGTSSVAVETCVLSHGYWKNHASAWPVRTLRLGDPVKSIHSYNEAALQSLLAMPPKGDASIILAMQLIAAKLNIANGGRSAIAEAAIARADTLLAAFNQALPYNVKSSTPIGADMTSTAAILDDFNNGRLSYSCTGANPAPSANAGPDQTVSVGALVTLSGAASSDPNGDALTFAWTMVSRPAGSAATLSSPSSVSPSFVADLPGSYTMQLIVNDGHSPSAPDTVRVSTRNSAPIAKAGGDQTARVGDIVRLDGSASTDADGDQLAFHWSFAARPPGSQAAFGDSSAIAPSFTIDIPGTYVAELVVRDAQLASSPDAVIISTLNSPPIANAGADISAQVGETITLNGTHSSDVDGDALRYAWSTISRPAGSTSIVSDPAAVQPTFLIDKPGSFVFQLIVNDGAADSAPDSVTVSTINSRPVANAGIDRSVFVGTAIQLDGSGSSDVDGNALSYSWSLTVRPQGSLATLADPAAVNPTFVADVPGSYVAQLIVEDGAVASDPDTVQLTTENRPPIADPGIAQTVPLGATVSLDGTASADPDGDAITYQWALLSTPASSTAQLANPTTAQPTFVADARGDYVAQLIVSDNTSSSAPRSVTISTENSAPIANAGPDQTGSVGATIVLDGTASLDPDGSALQYSWSLQSQPAGGQTVLSDPSAAAPSFLADRAGTYVVQLIVSDGVLASQPDALIVTITNDADLAIAIVNAPSGTLAPGAPVAFAVRIENLGPLDAHSVTAQFQLPSGYTGTVTPSAGSYGQSGEWLVGDLTVGTSAQLAIQATVNQAGALTLTAAVSSSDRNDPESTNNVAAAEGPTRPAATNHAPVITSLPPVSGSVGAPYSYDVVAVDTDQGDTLTFSLPIAPQGMSIEGGTGRVRWTPLGNQTGPINVAVHVRDLAGQLAAQGFTIDVGPGGANQSPLANDDRFEARTGESLGVPAPGVLINDSDPDGNRLSARLLSQPANGTAILNADGSLIYTPFTFQPGETVTADHVNLAVALPGSVMGGISGSSDAASAFDVDLGSFWRSGIANTAVFGYSSRELPYIEITFPQDVTPTELQVTGARASSFGKVLAGRFQMFDAAGDELFDGGILDLPAPEHDGKQSIPGLFNRRRNAARQPGAIYRASSSHTTLPADRAFDGNQLTAWQTPGAAPQYVEVELPAAITLHQVNVFGNRGNTTADYVTYVVQGFNAAGHNVFDSGPVTTTAATSDRRISVNDVPGVTRVRVTGTVAEGGSQGGFGEVEVISTESSPTRLNDRVRRVRFTDTADEPGAVNQAFLAEVRVVGSTSIRREAIVEANLAFLLPATVRASSSLAGNEAENAIDDTVRNWYATQAPGDFLELEFPSPVTVTEIQSVRPSATPQGFGSSLPIACAGTFALFAEDGTSLFSSGAVNQPAGGLGGAAFVVAVPAVSNVRRMRFTSAGCSGSWPVGFEEVRVLGTSDVTLTPIVAVKKYQSLFGLEVHSTPLVINLTDDNHDGAINHRDVPEIVVAVEDPANQLVGVLKVISGEDGRDVMTLGSPNLVSPWAEPAAADLDGDGRPEIIAVHSDRNHLIAFNADGTVRWTSDAHAMPQFALGSGVATGAISIANLDATGPPEIIVGASVFDSQGHVRGDGRTLGGSTGGLGLRSAISAVANIDLDGLPELVAGPTAYRLQAGVLTRVWQRSDRADGYVAIGNLDDDPFAEIVIVANGTIYALNHDGSDAAVWNAPSHAPVSIPGGGQGGAPTLADVDGDGVPEIGVAGAGYYTVFNRDGSIRWKAVISDRTSNATGATVFDLDNDGSAEIIYRDEAHLRIFRGRDGVLLSKLAIGSSTWSEMPVVADVDNDGHADIVVTSDRFFNGNNLGDTGLYVLTDVANRWARTRRVWNQHSYHVTNIDEDGAVPLVEPEHWLLPGLNAFRMNRVQLDLGDDGTDSFEYATSDGVAESDRAVVRVAVRTPNSAPQITSLGPASAAAGVSYFYAVEAFDPDAGDILTFSLTEAAAGMSIDAASGLIRWTPTTAQRGLTRIVVKVRDVRGLFALQGVTIAVGDPVAVPNVVGQLQALAANTITAASLTLGDVATRHSPTVAAGTILEQTPVAGILVAPAATVDLVVSLGPAPTGTVPHLTGMHQSAAAADIVAAGFTAGAISGRFDAAIASGVVLEQSPIGGTIAATGSAIAIVVSLGTPPADRDEDHDGVTGAQGDCNDANAAINPFAIDLPGDGIDQNCNGRDSIGGDATAPVAAIASPNDLAAVTMPTDIVGTATDANFLRYTLQLAEVDATSFTTIGSGDAPATSAVVGRIDPTLLENGLYRVRLIVEDVNGLTTTDERVYRIEGAAKVGSYRASFVDLSLPVAGIPITIVRTYDSRVKSREAFGVGWILDIQRGSARHNRTPGRGWIIRDQPVLGSSLPCIGGSLETLSHLTEVRLSDRESYRFALRINNGNLGVTGACEGQASYQFVGGIRPGATLEILDGTGVIYLRGGADTLLDMNAFLDGDQRVFDPHELRLRTADGRIIDVSRQRGITRIEDANGNMLSFLDGGIHHSSGKTVAFTRDEAGRITRITDPNGGHLEYHYDDRGDLAAFVDAAANQTTFRYDAAHNLTAFIDAFGRSQVTNRYDGDGRLIALTDAAGRTTAVAHDLDARLEVITDRLGGTMTIEYDARGNIVRRRDAQGHETTATFDGEDRRLTSTDALGRTQTFTYDADGNLATDTDPLGRMTQFTYNALGQESTRTGPDGGVTSWTYSARGNLVAETDAIGAITRFTYDAKGNQLTRTDARGSIERFQYDHVGNLVQVTDATGVTTRFGIDANGNRVSRTIDRADGTSMVWRDTFDAMNRPIAAIDPEGGVRTTIYGSTGVVTRTVDELGRATAFAYDSEDRRVATTKPDGTIERVSYDAEGREIARIDAAGRVTTITRDPVGHATRTVFADGTQRLASYDALGRVTTDRDELGRETTYEYDAAGQQTLIVNALGHQLALAYDAGGRVARQTAPGGTTTAYEYDAAGRLVRTTFADGSTVQQAFDPLGRLSARVDQSGHMTQFEYSSRHELTAVIDAMGQITRFSYDVTGNRISQTDALGRTTQFAYDAARRPIAETLPLGETTRRTYDGAGNVRALHNANGDVVNLHYDAMNRLTRRVLPDGETHEFAYTPTGQIAAFRDARGTTSIEYDDRDRPQIEHEPDGEEVRFRYDARGNRVQITTREGDTDYAFDQVDRLTAIRDARGNTTRYSYSSRGLRTGTMHANGVATDYGYDSLDRLISVHHSREGTVLGSYAYTLSPTGQRLQVIEHTGRRVSYTYDAMGRLTREEIAPAGGGASSAIAFTYNAVGNRLTKADNAGLALYSYDANDRITTAGPQQFGYDANGNVTSVSSGLATVAYNYDAIDRLRGVTNAAGVSTFTYDALSNRVQAASPSATANFLVDRFAPSGLAQVLRQADPGGVNTAQFVHDGGAPVSQAIGGGTSVMLTDAHGSVRLITDATGTVTDTVDYDAFGQILNRSGSTPASFLYGGQQFDPSTGWYYLRARYYDARAGRFHTTDPAAGSVFEPATLHRYQYAGNDPVNLADPSGETWSLASATAASGIAVTLAGIGYGLVTGDFKGATLVASVGITVASAGGVGMFYGWIARALTPVIPAATTPQGQRVLTEVTDRILRAPRQLVQLAETARAILPELRAVQEPTMQVIRLEQNNFFMRNPRVLVDAMQQIARIYQASPNALTLQRLFDQLITQQNGPLAVCALVSTATGLSAAVGVADPMFVTALHTAADAALRSRGMVCAAF